MGLFKRGSVWWMGLTCNGQQVRRSTETTDKKLAQRIFDKVKGEIAEGKWFEHLEGENQTFNDLMDRYMREHSAVNKAPQSYLRDKSIKKHLCKAFGNTVLTDITPKMISEYKVKRRGEGVSPRTVNYELTLMSHAFSFAVKEWEWVNDNPVTKVRKERVHSVMERWLTLKEEAKLLAASSEWLQEIIVFAIHTGLRQGEIINLKWSQIDFRRRTMTIFEQKNRCVDTLPLNETVLHLLSTKAADGSDPNEFVFTYPLQKRIDKSVLIRTFHKAIKKAKIQALRFHDLRHTFATRLVQNGVDLFAVQKLGRWKNTSMVMRYAHHYAESLRPGIEIMDKLKPPVSTILAHKHPDCSKAPYLRLVSS